MLENIAHHAICMRGGMQIGRIGARNPDRRVAPVLSLNGLAATAASAPRHRSHAKKYGGGVADDRVFSYFCLKIVSNLLFAV